MDQLPDPWKTYRVDEKCSKLAKKSPVYKLNKKFSVICKSNAGNISAIEYDMFW